MWQQRWNGAADGRWTHQLISDASNWISRAHRELDYYLIHILSGHGWFKAYLYCFHLDMEMTCPICVESEEIPEHYYILLLPTVRSSKQGAPRNNRDSVRVKKLE